MKQFIEKLLSPLGIETSEIITDFIDEFGNFYNRRMLIPAGFSNDVIVHNINELLKIENPDCKLVFIWQAASGMSFDTILKMPKNEISEHVQCLFYNEDLLIKLNGGEKN